ncbi:MAG: helix-turn-helix domain-containing protein [Treponema sp.]|nr:helix-turn-helix domain-containing protein [Treponema sp.]
MTKLNIIQKRELEPLMKRASRLAKHYEKASNCIASVMGADINSQENNIKLLCSRCNSGASSRTKKKCVNLHKEAVEKSRKLGGSYIYLCLNDFIFWTSPFYSGERFAGALLSGGVKKSDNNYDKVKSLAQIMLLCAAQITGMSYVKKNPTLTWNINPTPAPEETVINKQNKENNTISPIDMERMLLASLRRGDKAEGQKILVNLLKIYYLEVRNNFSAFRLKALELAVLLSRAVADPKNIMDNTSLETTNRCLKKIEDSSSLEEVIEFFSGITERMSGMIFSFHGVRHYSALRKAERYIWSHYTRKLSLKEIATASGLSAPYFSTVFKEEMGENLSNYLNRLRVEKAASLLVTTSLPISEIAVTCGFEDQSWFSKIFRNNTGFTPGKYREYGVAVEGNYLG